MSKKARQRRAASGAKPASATSARSATSVHSGRPGLAELSAEEILDAYIDDKFAELWGAMAAGDLLDAELETATLMALPRLAEAMDLADSETFVASRIVDIGARRPTPTGAAFLRLIISLGSPVVKRAASQALAKLTGEGIYPPEWAAEAGRAVPGEAWRSYDVFGDFELIVVTFSYGDSEHAIVVQVDLAGMPVAIQVAVVGDAAALIESIRAEDDPFDRIEQIHLAEARRHIEVPLARCDEGADPEISPHTIAYLPVARSRVRRLPAAAPPAAAPLARTFTAADRAAAVNDFMSSPQAAAAGPAGAVRFWAEVLAGYSSRVSGESPTQVGPHRLSTIILLYVPSTFAVSPAQREHMEPAVTAWTRWAAARQGLDEAATAHLMAKLPEVLADFDAAYDDPDYSVLRGYVADVATSDVDASWLGDVMDRRVFAVPFPDERFDDEMAFLDASDPADRAALAAGEFGSCTLPDGMTSEQFVAAVQRVIEELWHDDPPATWQEAQRMLSEGTPGHQIIHALAESAAIRSQAG